MIENIEELQKKFNADFFNIFKAALGLGLVVWIYYLAAFEVKVSYKSLVKECINNGQVEHLIDGKKSIVVCTTYERTALTEKFERVITNGKN